MATPQKESLLKMVESSLGLDLEEMGLLQEKPNPLVIGDQWIAVVESEGKVYYYHFDVVG